MKKLIFGAMLMIGMTTFAQEGKPLTKRAPVTAEQREKREQDQLKKMTSDLNLDANQQKALAEVLNERSQKREAFQNEHLANKEKGVKMTPEQRKERRAQMEAFRDEQDAKIKKILRADQLTQWEKMKAEEKENRLAKRQRKAGPVQKSE